MQDAEIKIKRAKEHIFELREEINKFFRTNPVKIATKKDPVTSKLVYYIADIRVTPKRLNLLAGEVIQSLRSALDYLAYALVLRSTGTTSSTRRIYFPISDSKDIYNDKKIRELPGATEDIINVIDHIKPYRGGNDVLWQLHKLNNIDKHRLLLQITGLVIEGVDIGADIFQRIKKNSLPNHFSAISSFQFFVRPADQPQPLKIGDILFVGDVDDEPNNEMEFKFGIGLEEAEADILNGGPLVEILEKMIQETEDTIYDISSTLGIG